jgi:hypothetical protein
MYLSGKGPLSLRSMARRLFECPLDPRRLKVVDVELLDAASNAVFAMHCWRKNENSALAGPSS